MSRFLETSQFLTELNALWDKHAKHIQNANTSLETLLKTSSKLPSTYISVLKSLDAAQKSIINSTTELNTVTKAQTKEITSLLNKRNALLANNKLLNSAIEALEEKLKRVNAQLSSMKDKTNAVGEAQSKAKNRIVETETEVEKLTTKLKASEVALNSIGEGAAASFRMVKSLMTAFGIQQGLFLAVYIAKNIYQTTKELQSLDLALKMVSGSMVEYKSNQAFIATVAEKWGIEIKGLTEQYTQFYTASKNILSTEKIKTVFESIAKSGALMGLSVEKQNAAFYAFEQMMSKGVVASEELKKQLGNAMPGAMKAAGMAYMELHPKIKSIQEAEAELMKDMKAGAIDSATYVPLIVKNFEKLYGIEQVDKVETLQAAQERLANSWTNLVRGLNESKTDGIGTWFAFILKGLTGLTTELDRFLNSWENIDKKANDRGVETGKSKFSDNISKASSREEAIAIVKLNQTISREVIATKQAELKSVEEKLKELNEVNLKNLSKAAVGISLVQTRAAHFRREKLLQELGYAKGTLQAANQYDYDIIQGNKAKNYALASQDKKLTKETAKEKAARLKLEKEAAKEKEDLLKNQYALELSNLEREKFDLEQSLQNKKNTYSDNLRLVFQLGVKEQEIAKLVHDEEIRLAGSSKEKRLIAENKYYKEKIKLAKDYLKMVEDIEFKPQYKDKNKVADVETYGSGVFETNESTLEEMKRLWKEQQDEKDKIAKQEADRLKAMRDVLNDIFKEFGEATGFEKTMDMFAKVGKNGKSFWENLLGLNGGTLDLKEGLTAGLTLTQDIGNKIAEGNQTRYEEELTRLENMKEYSLSLVGDNEAAKAKIEEDYQKKHDDIVRREAKSKKQQAMFNIAMDTAQAVMGLWVKPGFPAAIPLAIAVAALGAGQLAMVASKPLPSFYTGTDFAPEGLANTDEHGAEIHTDKYGNIKDLGSNSGPRIKYLNEGDKIIPAKRSAELMKLNDFSSLDEILSINGILYNDNKNIQLDVSEIVSGLTSIKESILNKETSEEHYDERGWTKYKKINGQKVEDKNNRIRFKKSII